MYITSVKEAMAAGLIKKAAEDSQVGDLGPGDLVHSGKDVYRVVERCPTASGDGLLFVKRTRDDRGCVGFAPSKKLVSEVHRMVADISAVCGPTYIKRVTVHKFSGCVNPDGSIMPEGQSYMYEWKWVNTPAEAREFVLHGNHRPMGYEFQAAYVQLGMGRAIIHLEDGVPAV